MKLNPFWENYRDIREFLFCHPQIDVGISLEEMYKNESLWNAFLFNFEKKFTTEYILKMIKTALAKRMEFIINKRASLYNINDKKRDAGVSFSERQKNLLDKIPILKEMEDETRSFYGRKIRPIKEWMTLSDVQSMKRLGMERFFIINFQRMVI
jgi:hypothetical protein